MSSPFENFENNALNGPYSADRIPELIELVADCVNASSLTEKGKSVRLGQLTNKLLKCNATVWSGLKMVNVSFDRVEIFIDRQDEVLNVVPMIVDAEGDSYDLEEASGKIDWMIPKSEIMRRAKSVRDNPNF